MSARIVGAFLATCLFVSLCGLVGPVAGAPMQDGQLEDDAGSAVPAIEDHNRSADRPFAEAGLDRTVSVGETVYLDAYGSRAAKGSLTAYEWRIDRPDGTSTTPACSTCELTEFRPTEPGQYNVTVTVEDEAGRTASDTLYVTVLDEPAPDANLTGPAEIQLNDTARIDLDASASTGELAAVEWYVDGDYREGKFLERDSFEDTLEFSPDSAGKHTISAVVRNDNGTARRVRHELVAREIASFEVEITDAAETVEAGQYWAPELEVTNTDSFTDTQEISLSISGGPSTVDSETITLDPGETQSFDDSSWASPMLAWFTSESADGPFTATVESETSSDTTTAEVLQPAFFEIEILEADPSSINYGSSETVSAEARVTNTGDKSDRQSIAYGFDDPEDLDWTHFETITLGGGESKRLDFMTSSIDDGVTTYHMRTDDDEDTENIRSSGSVSDSSSSSSGADTTEISFNADDVEVGEFATATVTSVTTRTGRTFSDPNNYISTIDGVKGFAFKDMSVYGTSGAVNLRGEPIAAGDGTRDETIRYKGVNPGTGELAGDIWGDRYDANLGTSDESDTFTVEPDGGGDEGDRSFPNGDDDEDSGTGGFEDTIEFPG